METQEVSSEEQAALEQDGAAVEGATEENPAEPDGDGEVVTDKDGQGALFPKDQKLKNLEADINNAYDSAEKRIRQLSEHASFFKKFSDYVGQLDCGSDRDVVLDNLNVALVRADAVIKDLHHARTQLGKAKELEEKQDELVKDTSGGEE